MEKMEDESPRNKVKFLCSYGGKVLPRPSDGVLKYVGGETRVICIPRDVTFADMMKKVSGVVDGEVLLKYQVIPEELDTLVSVRTEDDLKHMITELDRHESGGSPLLRAFLFPLKPLIVDNQSQMQMQQAAPHPLPVEPYLLEQRYLDAINGIIRPSPSSKYAACSACSSPKSISPDGPGESPFHYQGMQQLQKGMVSMQRVRSSPSLSSLTSTYNNTQSLQQQPQQHNHGISRSRSSHYQHQHHPLVGLRPIQEVGMGMGMGRVSPSQMSMNMMTDNMSSSSSSSRGMNYYYTNANRPHKAYAYHEDSVGHVGFERGQSVPRSPRMYLGE